MCAIKNEDVTKFARNSPTPMQHAGLGTAPCAAARPVSINIVTTISTFFSSCAGSWQACAHWRSIKPVGLGIGQVPVPWNHFFHIPQYVKQFIFLFSYWMATRIRSTEKSLSTENRILMKTPSNTNLRTFTSRCLPGSEHWAHPYVYLPSEL